jgi:hypothetical protein
MAQVNDPTWTPSELNMEKAKLDGQVVTLRGYLVHEPEAYAVWDSQEAMEAGDASSCISLLYPASMRSEIVRANRSSVLLVGMFRRNVTAANQVYLGLCNYTGIAVTQIHRQNGTE